MADPDPKLVIGIFIVLGIYSVIGGIITAKQAKALPSNMLGLLNTQGWWGQVLTLCTNAAVHGACQDLTPIAEKNYSLGFRCVRKP